MALLDDILTQLRTMSTFRWGTVTGVDPLQVQLDGDTLPLTPSDSLIDPAVLKVGDRVRVEMARLRATVHTRAWVATDERLGVSRFATQGEADAGTEPAAAVTPLVLRGRDYAPYAVAAGQANVDETFPTVTLPADRFTQPPIITAQLYSGAGGDIGVSVMVTNVTTVSFQMRHTAASGSKAVNWVAVQMTEESAAG